MQLTTAELSSEGDSPSNAMAALPLDARLLTALDKLGFTEPTPIQREAIGPLLAGRDVIGRARTGSGKTAAFGLPLLQRMLDRPRGGGVRALVLAPTRELARQVSAALRSFVSGVRLPILTVYGGSAYGPQLRGLREGASIVVGTPGRLIDLLDRGALDLSKLEMLVLDEADEMLRMGFIDDVDRLLAASPDDRQLALFSATMPPAIRRIAEKTARDPLTIQVEQDALAVGHIEQWYVQVPRTHHLQALTRLLAARAEGATLVFTSTRASCAELADALARQGIAADALHGDLDQSARERVLHRLRARRLEVVVATDIAARGIDVPHLALVINMELPRNTESYVHRIGRTGRVGDRGRAISLVRPSELRRVRTLERKLGVPISEQLVPSDAEISSARRTGLREALSAGRSEAAQDGARELLERLSAATGWSQEEVGIAALELLAAQHGLELTSAPDPRPPTWARRRAPKGARADRAARPSRSRSDKPRGDRGQRFSGGPGGVEIFLPIGHSRGVRPADIVGAITAEAGVRGRDLGRVTIKSHKTFVGVSEQVADQILREAPKLNIRGFDVRLARAFPRRPHRSR